MKPDTAYKDYISLLEDDAGSFDREETVREIEALLGDADSSNRRISWLESLSNVAGQHPDLQIKTIPNPFNEDQIKLCVEQGLLNIFQKNDVTLEQVVKFAHSIEGMQAFTDAIFQIPKENRADCWKVALVAPMAMPNLNIEELERGKHLSVTWNEIAQYVLDWMESMVTPQVEPALSLRDGSGVELEVPEGTAEIPEPGKIAVQIETLKTIQTGLLPADIAESWKKIPWDSLKDLISVGSTWESFLRESGKLIKSELDENAIQSLSEWLSLEDSSLSEYFSESRLLELILISTRMV